MAQITHTHVRSFSINGGAAVSSNVSVTKSIDNNVSDFAVAANSTNLVCDPGSIDVSKVVSLFMLAVGSDLTLKINSTSDPDETLTLKDGHAVEWVTGDSVDNPLGTVDVTTFYLTEAAGTAATFSCFILIDPALS